MIGIFEHSEALSQCKNYIYIHIKGIAKLGLLNIPVF